MAAVAREFRHERIDILAVCGGDGSFFRTLTAIVRAYEGDPLPFFLPLRAGSMNTIARSVGCRRGRPERVLTDAVADYRAGRPFETTERHLLVVNEHDMGFMVEPVRSSPFCGSITVPRGVARGRRRAWSGAWRCPRSPARRCRAGCSRRPKRTSNATVNGFPAGAST